MKNVSQERHLRDPLCKWLLALASCHVERAMAPLWVLTRASDQGLACCYRSATRVYDVVLLVRRGATALGLDLVFVAATFFQGPNAYCYGSVICARTEEKYGC